MTEGIGHSDAQVDAAIRSDPEMYAEKLDRELMAAYTAENTPPSYEPEDTEEWLRSEPEEPSRSAQLEAEFNQLVEDNPDVFRGTRFDPERWREAEPE